jgi:sec-independent protein translocase protein TatA
VFDFSPIQIILVLVIALVVFGPKRLPEMGRGLGRSIRDFKSSLDGRDERAAAEGAALTGPAPEAVVVAPRAGSEDVAEGAAVAVEAGRSPR